MSKIVVLGGGLVGRVMALDLADDDRFFARMMEELHARGVTVTRTVA